MNWDERRLGRHLKLRDLNILMTVAQCGSMGKAAVQLSLSQPAISKSIADMERMLGVRLLDRSAKGIEVTLFGRALLGRGSVAFDELKQAVKHIEFLADPTSGELRIGTTIALSLGFIPAVVEQFAKQYPGVVLHLSPNEPEATYRLLEQRNVDLTIARVFSNNVAEHLEMEALYEESYVVVAGVTNPWTQRRKIKLGDLVNEPWILPLPDSPTGAIVAEAFRASGVEVPRAAVFSSTVPARTALLATGRFLTMVPDSVLANPIAGPPLKVLPLRLPTTRRTIGIITLRNRTITPIAAVFMEAARRAAKLMSPPLNRGRSGSRQSGGVALARRLDG